MGLFGDIFGKSWQAKFNEYAAMVHLPHGEHLRLFIERYIGPCDAADLYEIKPIIKEYCSKHDPSGQLQVEADVLMINENLKKAFG